MDAAKTNETMQGIEAGTEERKKYRKRRKKKEKENVRKGKGSN